jgi:hypothetical protein
MILGEEKSEAAHWWNEMKRHFPNWPGFRPERCSHLLAAELRRAQQSIVSEVEHLNRVAERAKRIAEIRASPKSGTT